MTGPEHYRRAEALLESCQLTSDRDADGTVTEIYPDREDNGAGELTDSTSHALMAAQAHATLAHAAATAEPIVQTYTGGEDTTVARAWAQVLG